LLLLTAVTGLRCGEVLGLKWEDIDASAQKIGLHVLRHSLATSLISWGLHVKTVQGLLRHSNSQTTLDIYTQGVCLAKLPSERKVDLAFQLVACS
jgi:integrase